MIAIVEQRSANDQEWDEIWRGCRYATYFHSREWAEVWSRYQLGKLYADPRMIRFDDGKIALLPLSRRRKGGRSRGISSPADTYGGWIALDELSAEHGVLLRDYLTCELGDLDWQLNPFDPLKGCVDIEADEPDVTQVVRLGGGFDEVYNNWSSSCRRAERRARKSGVVVEVATTAAEWREVFEVYRSTLQRWGIDALMAYSENLFGLLSGCNGSDVRLWLAKTAEGKIIAGAVVLYAKAHAVYWLGAALKE